MTVLLVPKDPQTAFVQGNILRVTENYFTGLSDGFEHAEMHKVSKFLEQLIPTRYW